MEADGEQPVAVGSFGLPRVQDVSPVGALCRKVNRLVQWLRVFALIVALLILAPVQSIVFSAARIALAGGLALIVAVTTTLVRRGRLLPTRAYAISGVGAVVGAALLLFVAEPRHGGSGARGEVAVVVVLLAIPAVRMNRRYIRGCASAEVSLWCPVRAARIPPLTGVTTERHLRIHLGLWVPVLFLMQLLLSALLLSLAALNFVAGLPILSGRLDRLLEFIYARVRFDLHNTIGRLGGYRDRARLDLFACSASRGGRLPVRGDVMRWGKFLPHAVDFREYLVEQLWLYGVPRLVDGKSRRAWAAPQRLASAGEDVALPSSWPVLLIAPGVRGPTAAELDSYAPRALLVLPPDRVGLMSQELIRVAPRIGQRLLALDERRETALLLAVAPDGALTVLVADARSQWNYMAALETAAQLLGLARTTDTPDISTSGPNVPLTASLGVGTESSAPSATTPRGIAPQRLGLKALAAVLLGAWSIPLITSNARHAVGGHQADFIFGVVLAPVAICLGVWAALEALKRHRLATVALALGGVAVGCAGAIVAVNALSA